MQVVFRVDASISIGTGHVMRCLTLAEGLRQRGAICQFICRDHPGNLIDWIRQRDFSVHVLPLERGWKPHEVAQAHASLLGTDWQSDAEQTQVILDGLVNDWLIVDHYALDAHWERALAQHYRKLMVIDDLADRPHACDLLLDQTFGRDVADYRALVPADCKLLCGSEYALLRPEFAALRSYSLQRRARLALREVLITMGGVDKDNVTGQVLQALHTCPLPADCQITVVMGATAPWMNEVRSLAGGLPWPTRVLVGITDMAQRMADSDLTIGAAGASSWERCCLGVPTIMLVLAENQLKVAHGLEQAGAALIASSESSVKYQLAALLDILISSPNKLQAMSKSAASIVNGMGVRSVLALLET